MQPIVKTIEIATGVTLSYAEHGDPAGLPVVALHGFTDSWRSFEPLMPHLPRRLRLLAVSQRGHGDSQRPAAGYRTREMAGDVAAFMDALGIERSLVVGHSMGGVNTMRFAIDHPGRVLGLMLAGTMPSFALNPDLIEFWRKDVSALVDPIDPAFVRDFQQSTLAQTVSPAFLDMVVGESLKLPARVWRAACDGFMTDDSASKLGAIKAPTLIVWGRHDAILPPHRHRMSCWRRSPARGSSRTTMPATRCTGKSRGASRGCRAQRWHERRSVETRSRCATSSPAVNRHGWSTLLRP